ncbi:MAG: efflux RND transporter permease subunit [Desulfovibrionaceae bacterium]|jgi:HAE1 family hydrophobic/amphiphilic exporter-1|nr:efflux RND transporter permease subunit [Desulfovibrionaceae bacterium]
MDIIRAAVDKPVAVLVGVILIVLFGVISLNSLPYQLSPTVTEPEITVSTTWSGATPYEMEREVIEEQEKVLKGIPGLVTMESTAYNAYSEISLTFEIGTDVDNALLRVSNKLNEVPEYPDNVDKPVISASGASASPVIWLILKPLPGNDTPINTYGTYFENEVRQHLERVKGVADLFIFGGTDRQMQVIVDPDKLSAYGLTVNQVVQVLESENANVSAGVLGVGRRDYRIRTVGQFNSPEQIERTVITSSGQRRITVADVARVEFGYEKLQNAMLLNGERGIVCGVEPETGANILELTDAMEAAVNDLNAGRLKEQGVYLEWNYDQRPYINGAIDLVSRNIMVGAILAVIVLLTFLRSASSTFIVAAAIPISAVGCFIFLNVMHRTLNVVSLAGISFAVGMLVDNAIVVLENIDRHRKKLGKSPLRASLDGAKEVYGAVLASTATTVAVFLPVVFMEQEAGQLFKDIAIAVTSAILLSMLVSVWVIPTMATRLFAISERRAKRRNGNGTRIPVGSALKAGDKVGGVVMRLLMAMVRLATRNWATRVVTIGTLTTVAVGLAWGLMPKMEYLPQGNRNLLLNIMIPPPGLSYEERRDIGKYVWSRIEPLRDKEEVELPGLGRVPGVKTVFYVGADRIMIFGAISTQEDRAGELVPFMSGLMNSIPGMFGVSLQAGVFQEDLGGGRAIDVDLSNPDMTKLVGGTGALFGALAQAIPGAQIRPVPSLELLFPEVRLIPDRDRLRAASMTTEELGVIMDVLMDGRAVDDFKQEGEKKIDLVVKADDERYDTPEKLYDALVYTEEGRTVPVSSLATLDRVNGMNQIRHLERDRTITLEVTPPKTMPLEQAMDVITSVVGSMSNGPLEGLDFKMSGAADKLTTARSALQWNFLLAVLITYLLMAALFENFIYPLVVLFTVPLSAGGGMAGLWLENTLVRQQPLDILTMLGFIILVGVVVNNAILIVHQALVNIRELGMEHREAVLESVHTRIRPIFMSATTSIFGMLPLAVVPGPGAELYAGLGSVVLGGLAFSTMFTLFVTPSMLLFFLGMEGKRPDDGSGPGAPEHPDGPEGAAAA